MTDKAVLITRPMGDEKTLTDILHSQGYRVMHEPLTSILLHHTRRHELQDALLQEPDAVIVTSRHGVHALSILSDLRDGYLICVGEGTAKAAHSLGFTRVFVAGGNARKLLDMIATSYDAGTSFLYVSGEHVRVDIGQMLSERNMQAQRLVLYEAVAAEQFSDILIEQLKRRQLDAVTFMSPRTAQIFAGLLVKAGVEDSVAHLHAICLSAAVAEALGDQPWKQIHISDEATLASLIECVDNVFYTKG